jgi:hypothetical protein
VESVPISKSFSLLSANTVVDTVSDKNKDSFLVTGLTLTLKQIEVEHAAAMGPTRKTALSHATFSSKPAKSSA